MISSVTLIGSGRVAANLGSALSTAGIRIEEIYSLHFDHARSLARTLNATACKNPSDLSLQSDLILVAVNDDQIGEVARAIPNKQKAIAHTSGSKEMSVFAEAGFQRYGVFYPLQSLSKEEVIPFDQVPLCIEGVDAAFNRLLTGLAEKISRTVVEVDSEHRRQLHLAAVFANNFTNHLFAIAADILEEKQLSFDLLKPLIMRTAEKVQTNSPLSQQTGPAVRNDQLTMGRHLKMLKSQNHRSLYELFNKSILQMKKSENH